MTGNRVISPRHLARVDLPDAPRPKMTTRFIISSVRHCEVAGFQTLPFTRKLRVNLRTALLSSVVA